MPARLKALLAARGWIFDIDDTILASREGHVRAWDRTTRAHGPPLSKEEIVRQFGKTTAQIATTLLHLTNPAIIEAISREKARYFLEEVPHLQLFEGVREVFQKLKQRGVSVALATSNERNVVDLILPSFSLSDLVAGTVSLDEISKGKPDPEMILKAAQVLRIDPRECVMVGDTIYDIQAGQRAGCRTTVGVLTGHFTREQLAAEKPTLILPHVKDLLQYL